LIPHIAIVNEIHFELYRPRMSDHRFIFVSAGRALTLKTIAGVVVFCIATMAAVCGMIAGQA
jgi:hypothetical protein